MSARLGMCARYLHGLVVVLLLAAASPTGEYVAFGPETFQSRNSSTPYSRSFSVLDVTGSYVIRVRNGGTNGEFHRVASVRILIDDALVVRPNDINPQIEFVEKPISLHRPQGGDDQHHAMTLEVHGEPGSAISVSLVGFDTVPPSINATATPSANANGWNDTPVDVRFTCSDATSGILTCPAQVTVETEGANQVVSGTAVDRAGNTASASATLNIDRTLPMVSASVSPPPNERGWNNTNATVIFTCQDALSGVQSCTPPVTIVQESTGQSVDGISVDRAGNMARTGVTVKIDRTVPDIVARVSPDANANGWYNRPVDVSFACSDVPSGILTCPEAVTVVTEGENQVITGTAVDRASNASTARATFNIDLTGPVISASPSPQPNSNGWNNTPVAVSFMCSDAISGVLTCPESVTLTTEGSSQLVSGTAVDRAGNSSNARATLNIDLTAPVISASLNPPPNGNGWNNTPVNVQFACSDGTAGILTCPAPVPVSTDGANQAVTGTAVDRAGNEAISNAIVNLDLTRPVVTASLNPSPNSDGWNNTDVTVTFSCQDTGSGVETCSPPVVITDEAAGRDVEGVATDRAGNAGNTRVTVNLDRTAPQVTIISPASGELVVGPSVMVTGTAVDAVSGVLAVTCNGSPVMLSGPNFTCTVPVNPGSSTITVEGRDHAANVGSAQVSVSLSPPAIGVTITSPAPLALFRTGPVTVEGVLDRPADEVIVNGIAAVLNGLRFTATGVTLREGYTVLTATANGPGGSVGSGSVTVMMDATSPTVRIDSPAEGALVTTSQVTVTGMVNDIVSGTVNGEQASVTVNGVPAAISNRSFVVNDVLLVRGLNTLTAVARDRAGNESQTQIHVTFQSVAGQQRIEILGGNNQVGAIGSTLPEPLLVDLVDAFGRPLVGRPVTFAVTRSDGIVKALPDEGRSVTSITDEHGQARVLFQLGTRTGAGNNQVIVTSPGFVGDVIFAATATPGPPVRISADTVMGENFRGAAGAALSTPFVVRVSDAGGNPVAGVPVTFTVSQGGGLLDGNQSSVTKSTNSDGKADATLTLAPASGITNDVVTASFEGLAEPPAIFTATALPTGPVSLTRVSGVVVDNTNTPIPNVRTRIKGTSLEAFTNEHGQFTIQGVPVGSLFLEVDGSTSTRPETFPMLAFTITTVAGQDNTIGMPIYLPPLDTANSRIVGGDEAVNLEMAGVPGVVFTVMPHSATFKDGSRVGRVVLTQVHADKVPMPPPFGTAPRIVWTLQPAGTRFDPPIRVQLPNTDGLPPGQVVELFQFDHDIEQFVSVGTARVTADGALIVSDPGFGITKAGWGGAPPPAPPKKPCVSNCGVCKTCREGTCVPTLSIRAPGIHTSDVACGDDPCIVNGHCTNSGTCEGDKVEITKVEALADGKKDNTFKVLGKAVVFTANVTQEHCPSLVYNWDFGDGISIDTSVPYVMYVYNNPGTYVTTVTVGCETCSTAQQQAAVRVSVFKAAIKKPTGDPLQAGSADNQFDYTGSEGIAEIPVEAQIVPEDMSTDVSEFIRWTLFNVPLGSTVSWKTSSSSSAVGWGASNTATLAGYPERNSEFGRKVVRMEVVIDGKVEATEEAQIALFFERDATARGRMAPNWFFYWNQTNAGDPYAEYDETIPIRKGGALTPAMYFWCTYAGPRERILFSNFLWNPMNTFNHRRDRRCLPNCDAITGIDKFANAVAHEREHVAQIWANNNQPFYKTLTGSVSQAPASGWSFGIGKREADNPLPTRCTENGPDLWNHFDPTKESGSLDDDRDDMANALELREELKESCEAFTPDLFPRIEENEKELECGAQLKENIPEGTFKSVDWSSPGKQHY